MHLVLEVFEDFFWDSSLLSNLFLCHGEVRGGL